METNLTGELLDRRRGWGHWTRLVGGWLLLLVGVVGFVIPVIPGIPLVLGGLAALSCEYAWARRWHQRVLCWWAALKAKFSRKQKQ